MKEKLLVYWYGYGGNSWLAEKLRYMIEDELNMKLVTIHEHPNADIPWKLETVFEELKKADIIIVPANYKRQPCKSNNRVTQAMALKKPVICDPMPAYKEVIDHTVNGFITNSGHEKEYLIWLKYLRDNPEKRKEVSEKAYKTSQKYSLTNIASRWITDVLIPLNNKRIKKDKIDVVIPTKDNIPILDECLKSFRNSTMSEDVYIIDNDTDSNKLEELIKKYDIPYEIKEI